MAALLEIEGLHVDIETENATLRPVRGIDLSVERGQTVAIVGESGCGKSLTALAIMGLLPRRAHVSAQRIEFAGKSLTGLSAREWREIRGNRITMIFQNPMTALDPCYTVGSQMVEILRQHRHITGHDARMYALKLCEQVRIPSPLERFEQYPHQLSGGLRQRVMIAMSLLCKPDLIIADEPTTALDVTIQAQILRLLSDIQQATGVGLIIITHDIGVVAGIADKLAVMYSGQIVEYGSTQRILAKPLHPYTEGLLRSIPVPGRVARRTPLGFIPGIVPRPVGVLTECAFAARCPYVTVECRRGPVDLRRIDDDHSMRCILPGDGTGRDPDIWTRSLVATTP